MPVFNSVITDDVNDMFAKRAAYNGAVATRATAQASLDAAQAALDAAKSNLNDSADKLVLDTGTFKV